MAQLLAPSLPGWSMAGTWRGLLVWGGSEWVVVLWLQQAWAVFRQPLGQPVKEMGLFQVTFFLKVPSNLFPERRSSSNPMGWCLGYQYFYPNRCTRVPVCVLLLSPGLWKLSRERPWWKKHGVTGLLYSNEMEQLLSACGFKYVYTTQLLPWLTQQWVISKYSGCIILQMSFSLLKHSLQNIAGKGEDFWGGLW